MRTLSLWLLSLVVLACGPRPGELDAGLPPGGFDLHLHCQNPTLTCDGGVPCCDVGGWSSLTEGLDAPAGALLSLEHYTLISPDAGRPPSIPFQNQTVRLHAQAPTLVWFASLPCWHAQPWGPGWLEACKADVDAQLQAGAKGFKDHTGKTFMHSEAVGDGLHWLGAWNRVNALCTAPPGSTQPNAACLASPGAVYPTTEAGYRALVRYIVEEKQAVLVTHLRDWGDAPERCFDPALQAPRRCADLTRDQALAFAAWARGTLTPEAARRVVVAHMAFVAREPETLNALLEAGLSVDTAALITQLRHCEARALIARYPRQIAWGSDAELGSRCLGPSMASWNHLLSGAMDDERRFTGTCSGDVTIKGLELRSAKVKACQEVLPEQAYERVAGGNARELLGL